MAGRDNHRRDEPDDPLVFVGAWDVAGIAFCILLIAQLAAILDGRFRWYQPLGIAAMVAYAFYSRSYWVKRSKAPGPDFIERAWRRARDR